MKHCPTVFLVIALGSFTICCQKAAPPASRVDHPNQTSPPVIPAPPARADLDQPSVQSHVIDQAEVEQVDSAVQAYAKLLADYQQSKGHRSLEPVFRAGTAAVDTLTTSNPSRNGLSFLESHTDTQLAPILKEMHGYVRSGETGQLMLTNWKFFRALADSKGNSEDSAFFQLMDETKLANGFTNYTEQVTDDTACIAYGTGALTGDYARLLAFQKNFPQAYRPEIDHAFQDMQTQLTEGDCACEGKDSVIHEFELFVKTCPEESIAPKVRQRLEDVRNDRIKFRYQCRPS